MMLRSLLARLLSRLRPWRGPRMRHGIRRHDGAWLPHTRISTATQVEDWSRLDLGDHVFIGHFNFIGPNSVVAPGSRLGKGVLVKAFSYVRGEVPDFAVVQGQPAQVVGDTRDLDAPWLERHPELQAHYRQWTTAPAAGQGTT